MTTESENRRLNFTLFDDDGEVKGEVTITFIALTGIVLYFFSYLIN